MKALRKLYFDKAPDVPNSSLPDIFVRSAMAPKASVEGAAVPRSVQVEWLDRFVEG